jgi:hypothetical protein
LVNLAKQYYLSILLHSINIILRSNYELLYIIAIQSIWDLVHHQNTKLIIDT